MTISKDQRKTIERTSGVVQSVDLIARTVSILRDSRVLRFDVPASCTILLHGEPVRLHLLQSQDRVRVTYRRVPGGLEAQRIEAPSP